MTSEAKAYLTFVAIKLAGYVLACVLVARRYQMYYSKGILAGVTRTLIGMAVGAILYFGFALRNGMAGLGGLPAVTLLGMVRVCEWGAVFWMFFKPGWGKGAAFLIPVAIAWSFLLDFIGIFLLAGLLRGIVC